MKLDRTEINGPGKLLGYRMMQRKLCEQHDLAVLHSLVYNVMTDEYPEGLEARANFGLGRKKKRTNWNIYIIGNCHQFLL